MQIEIVDDWVSQERQSYCLLHFTSFPRPFLIFRHFCLTSGCDCNTVKFEFIEADKSGKQLEDPIVFEVDVDALSWHEINPRKRSRFEEILAEEFIEEYPRHEREACKETMLRKRREASLPGSYRFDARTMRERLLVPYLDILYPGKKSLIFDDYLCCFEHEEHVYFADDYYCVSPDCDCQSVHLYVARTKVKRGDLNAKEVSSSEPCFKAKLTFDGKIVVEEILDKCGKEAAKKILKEWSHLFLDDIERLKKRYALIKEIGRLTIQDLGESLFEPEEDDLKEWRLDDPEPAAKGARTGRNAPCPCGSGKKYKKCCGNSRKSVSE